MQTADYAKQIPVLVHKINYKIDSILRAVTERHGLTGMQWLLLMQLRHYGGHTVGALGKVTGLLSANVSAACKRLEKVGLLHRVRNREDERFVKVELTKKGSDVVDSIERDIDERCAGALESKEEHDLSRAVQVLNCLYEIISQI